MGRRLRRSAFRAGPITANGELNFYCRVHWKERELGFEELVSLLRVKLAVYLERSHLRLSVASGRGGVRNVPSAGFEPAAYCSGGSRSIP